MLLEELPVEIVSPDIFDLEMFEIVDTVPPDTESTPTPTLPDIK